MTIYAMRPMLTGKSETDPRVEADSPEAAAKKLAPSHFGDLIPRKVGTPSVNWSVYTRNKAGEAVETRLYVVPEPKAPKAPKAATVTNVPKADTPTLDAIAESVAKREPATIDLGAKIAKFRDAGAKAQGVNPAADLIEAACAKYMKADLIRILIGGMVK